MSNQELRVHLFGVMSLEIENNPVELPTSAIARRLLAYLLLQKDRPHPRSVVAGTFWGEQSEARARKSLSQALWHIRQSLPDLLNTSTDEITFTAPSTIWTDTQTFESTINAHLLGGEENPASLGLSAALDLYRGELLEGIYDDWVLLERERLSNLHLRGLEKLAKLEKMSGNYQHALDLTQQLLKRRPYDESFHQEAMRLYYQLGKADAALRQYESCCKLLKTEFNVEPEAKTVLLAQEIARQSANVTSIYLPKPVSSQKPINLDQERATSMSLIGREKERDELLHHLEATFQNQGGIVLIEGEAGVGKTRLLREIAQDAEWRNAQILWGHCLEHEAVQPFGPFVTALNQGLSPLRVRQLSAVVDPLWLQVLKPFLPQIAQTLPGLDTPPPLKPEQEPARVLQAMANFLTGWANIAPLLLIIEDLHWADEDTLSLLPILQNQLQEHRVLLVGTFRGEDARAVPKLWERLQALDRAGLRGRQVLEQLDFSATGKLIRRCLGLSNPAPVFEKRIYNETEGNPLFVLETLRTLQDEGLLKQDADGTWRTPWDDDTVDYAELPLPPMVEQVIERRLKRLEPLSQQVLNVGLVLGYQFDFSLLLSMSELGVSEILEPIQDLINRQLWEETEEGYRFSHAKVRQVGLSSLSADELAQLHAQAVAAFEAHAPNKVDALAYHCEQAGLWEKAAEYAWKAGLAAMDAHAYLAARTFFDKVLAFREKVEALAVEHFELLAAYEKVLNVLGERDAQTDVLSMMQVLADEDLEKSYLVYLRRAWLWANKSQYEDSQDAALRALDLAKELGALQQQADALDVLGTALTWQGQSEKSIEHLLAAIEIAQNLGDVSAEAHYRSSLGSAYLGIRKYDEAMETMETSLKQSIETANLLEQADLYNLFGISYMERGMAEKGLDAYHRSLECCQQIGYLYGEGRALANLGTLYYFQGDTQKVLALYDKTVPIFAQLNQKRGEIQIRLNRASVTQDMLGHSEQVSQDAEISLAYGQEVGDALSEGQALTILAEINRLHGDLPKARELLMQGIAKMNECGDRWLLVQEYRVLGYLDLEQDMPEEALEHLAYALDICQELSMTDMEVLLLGLKGLAHARLGDSALGLEFTQKAMDGLKPGVEQPYLVPLWHAEVLTSLGKDDESALAIQRSYELLQDVIKGLSPEQQEMSLVNVPEHRAIVQAWERQQPNKITVSMPKVGGGTVDVHWTVDAPEDEEIAKKVARRRHQLRRLLKEAAEQGGAPTYQHLADALLVGLRTIERDMSALAEE